MREFKRVMRDIALLVARIVAGVTLVAHGWHRWQETGLDVQVALVEATGLPNAAALVVATVAFELIGGVLLVFGLATPLVGLGMAVLNVAIIVTTKADGAFYAHLGGWEYNAIQAALGLMFLVYGSGRAGLDNLFVRPKDEHDSLIAESPQAQTSHS
ncbi:DoxX family protein [Tessaracoccus sp. Z1128]